MNKSGRNISRIENLNRRSVRKNKTYYLLNQLKMGIKKRRNKKYFELR